MQNLFTKAKLVLDQYPEVRYHTDENSIHVERSDSTGFEVGLVDEGDEATLLYGDWHYPFKDLEEVLCLFDDCLSGNARLREVSRLGIKCKGILELREGDSDAFFPIYEMALIDGLFLFPFPKREKTYCNHFHIQP